MEQWQNQAQQQCKLLPLRYFTNQVAQLPFKHVILTLKPDFTEVSGSL